MKEIWKLFPKISENVEKFHLTPSYIVIIKKNGEVEFGNRACKEFLVKCINSYYKNLKEILLEIYSYKVFNEKEKEISEFVREAVKRGVIELEQVPFSSQIKITGSEKFFIPVHISIELTSKCNLSCIYCYNEFLNNKEEIDYKILIERLEEWIDLGLMGVELTGGEPFLYSRLKDVIEFCAKNLKSVGILTNGSILNNEWVKYFIQIREKYGIDILFAISLDAACPETFSKITGSHKFHNVIDSIRSLSSNGFKVRVGTVISPYNFKELEKIVQLSIKNGAYKMTWSSVLPFGKGKNLAWIEDVQFYKEAQEIEKNIYNKYKDFIAYFEQDLVDQINKFVNCGIGHKNAVISPHGYIRPCLLLPENKWVFGNLKKNKIIEIFSNPALKLFGQISPPDFKTCGNCNFKYYCRGCILRPLSVKEKFPKKECRWMEENNEIKEILKIKND